jgi:hypothetical protein
MAALHLFDWQGGGTSFTSLLYCAFAKADHTNFSRLASAYPFEAAAYLAWVGSPNPEEFFRQYGVQK